MKKTALFCLLFFYAIVASPQVSDTTIAWLDRYFSKAQQDWQVPGMAVGIVKDGKLILAKGYGVREAGKEEKADFKTLFAIASNTKAFTSAAIARLVDEGKLNWDDRVTQHIPWFRLYDPYVTANFTVRDLLCHRSGLKTFSGDLLWNSSIYSRKEVIKRASLLKPSFDFRSGYGYSNIMFLAAGEVIEAVSGKTWDAYITENFLDPLGMKQTVLSVKELTTKTNIASPHIELRGKNKAIAWENWDNMSPAGSMISSVEDLAKWVSMQLAGGTWEGKTYFSKKQQRIMWEAHNPQAVSESSEKMYPGTHYKAAGLGWFTFDYKGVKVVNHGGGYIGMVSKVALVPEKGLGIIVLTNAMEGITGAVVYKTLDAFLGGTQTDWSAEGLKNSRQAKEKEEKRVADFESSRIAGTSASLPLEKYTGTYGGPLYGNAEVSLNDGKLLVRFLPTPAFHSALVHRHYDTFEIYFPDFPYLPKGTLQFLLNEKGEASEFKIDIFNYDFHFDELEFKRIK